MERFIKGDIVIVLFPFSDLSNAKKRPALVLARLGGDDTAKIFLSAWLDIAKNMKFRKAYQGQEI